MHSSAIATATERPMAKDLLAFQSTLLRRAGDPKFLGIVDYNGDGIIDLVTDNAMFMLRDGKKPK